MTHDPHASGPRDLPRIATPRWLRLPRVNSSDAAWELRHDGVHLFLTYRDQFAVRFRASEGNAPGDDRRRIGSDDGVEMWLEGDQAPARAQIARRLWDGLADVRPLLGRMLRLTANPPERWHNDDLGPLTAAIAAAFTGTPKTAEGDPRSLMATPATEDGTAPPAVAAGAAPSAARGEVGPDDAWTRHAARVVALARAAGGAWQDLLCGHHPVAAGDSGKAQLLATASVDAVDALLTGRGQAAVDACERVARLQPELLALCVDTIIATGRVADAAAVVRRMPVPAPPGVRRQWSERAAALFRAGDSDGAEAVAATAGLGSSDRAHWHTAVNPPIDDPPDRRAAVVAQSRILFEPPDVVVASLRGLRSLYPDSELLHTYTGEIFLWQGDYATAHGEFAAALARYDRSRWAHVGLATVAMLEGDLREASRLLDRLAALVQPSPFATTHMIAGEVALRQGDLDRAERELRIAVDAKHTRFAGWLNLAEIHRRRENADEVERCLAAFNRFAPGAIVETTTRLGYAPTVAVRADTLEQLWEPLLEGFRGNRSSGYMTFVPADGGLRMARLDLGFVQRFAAATTARLACDPEFIAADITAWLQTRRDGAR